MMRLQLDFIPQILERAAHMMNPSWYSSIMRMIFLVVVYYVSLHYDKLDCEGKVSPVHGKRFLRLHNVNNSHSLVKRLPVLDVVDTVIWLQSNSSQLLL